MARPKGLPKTGGRKRGVRNRRALFVPSDAAIDGLAAQEITALIGRLRKAITDRLWSAACERFGAYLDPSTDVRIEDDKRRGPLLRVTAEVIAGAPEALASFDLDVVRKSIPGVKLGERITWEISAAEFLAGEKEHSIQEDKQLQEAESDLES